MKMENCIENEFKNFDIKIPTTVCHNTRTIKIIEINKVIFFLNISLVSFPWSFILCTVFVIERNKFPNRNFISILNYNVNQHLMFAQLIDSKTMNLLANIYTIEKAYPRHDTILTLVTDASDLAIGVVLQKISGFQQ